MMVRNTLWGLFALAVLALFAFGPVPDPVGFFGGVTMAGFLIPVSPKTNAQLNALANPSAVAGGQNQAQSWVFYDQQLYTSAATTALTFFSTTNVSPAVTNMEAGGQLPSPKYFQIYYFGCDILNPVTSSAAGAATFFSDVQQLVMDGQGTFRFTMSDKVWGPFPLSFCHTSGGVTGFGFSEGTTLTATAAQNVGYGNNSFPDGGWCVDGSILIEPKVGFNVRVEWPAALTLGANRNIRFWMAGVLHRRVL